MQIMTNEARLDVLRKKVLHVRNGWRFTLNSSYGLNPLPAGANMSIEQQTYNEGLEKLFKTLKVNPDPWMIDQYEAEYERLRKTLEGRL